MKEHDSYRDRVAEHRIPRGIVDEETARTKFTLTRHPSAVPEYVEYYWILHWDLTGQDDHVQRVLPNLSVTAAFFPDTAAIFGPAHDVFEYRLRGRVQGLGVRFRPGCFRPFLGAPVTTITDRSVPLTDVFGPAAVTTMKAVRIADGDQEMADAVDNLLSANPRPVPAAVRRATDVVETIAADPGITRVDRLCAATGLSIRSVQRLFAEHVGCAPKWAIRIYRLNDAARLITQGAVPDYAGLAVRLGYSDQSHFIRDFRTVTGQSPTEYARSAAPHPRT